MSDTLFCLATATTYHVGVIYSLSVALICAAIGYPLTRWRARVGKAFLVIPSALFVWLMIGIAGEASFVPALTAEHGALATIVVFASILSIIMLPAAAVMLGSHRMRTGT